MSHGSCRKVSNVLSIALQPISKSAVHYLAKRVPSVKIATEPRYRMCIAVDETKLSVKGVYVYVWSAVDMDSRELLALEASYGRSCLIALTFFKAEQIALACGYRPIELCWMTWLIQPEGTKMRMEKYKDILPKI